MITHDKDIFLSYSCVNSELEVGEELQFLIFWDYKPNEPIV